MDSDPAPVTKGNRQQAGLGLLAGAPAWLRNAAAALPVFAIGLVFAYHAVLPNTSAGTISFLAQVLQTQFLVIHSSAYFLLLLTIRSRSWVGTAVRVVGLTLFGSLYVYFLYQFGKLWALDFAVLTVCTWLGPMTRLRDPDTVAELIVRWVVSLVVFLTTMGITGMPEGVDTWTTCSRVQYAGVLYYLAMGGLELSPVYPVGIRFVRGVKELFGALTRMR